MTRTRSAVQREIGQGRPFRSPSQEGAVALMRTADVLRRRFSEVLEPFGITFAQYNVLRILRGARQGLPTLEVSNRLIEQAPGITRMMDRLETKGWVRRTRSGDDRRQVMCHLTRKGEKLLARIDPVMDRADDAALAMLGRSDQQKLIRLLNAVRGGLG